MVNSQELIPPMVDFNLQGISQSPSDVLIMFSSRARIVGGLILQEVDRRLDRMIEIAEELDIPLDVVVHYMGRCDQSTFRAFSDNPSSLPRKIKSKSTP